MHAKIIQLPGLKRKGGGMQREVGWRRRAAMEGVTRLDQEARPGPPRPAAVSRSVHKLEKLRRLSKGKDDVFAGELLVDSAEGLSLVFQCSDILGVKEALDQLGSVESKARPTSNDVGGV